MHSQKVVFQLVPFDFVNADAGVFASLKIVEIPLDVEWEIFEYDGIEEIHEKKRKWS